MIVSSGSSPSACTVCSGTSSAGLEAQLARYRKELSEHVNCSSAKTPEGKTAIAAIERKIGSVKTRMEALEKVQSVGPPVRLEVKIFTASGTDNMTTASAQRPQNAALGSRLDVLA